MVEFNKIFSICNPDTSASYVIEVLYKENGYICTFCVHKYSCLAKILPIIMMECSRQLVMHPGPMQSSPSTLQSVVFQLNMLGTLHSI